MIANLGSLELRARLVVEGFIAGLHRSPFHGFSAEFSEHRQYRPGDDLKYLDWKIYGRSNRFYIKQFQDETNLRCLICVDSSASMRYASEGNISKYDYAVLLAASLSYLVLQQRDAAGIALYNEHVHTYLPPRSKKSYISELLRVLNQTTPSNATGTAKAIHHIAEQFPRRGLVVLLSDFFDTPNDIRLALQHLRHEHHDILALQIVDPKELTFDFGDARVFRDMETNQEITTQPLQIAKAYSKAMQQFCSELEQICFQHNVQYARMATSTPFDFALREYITKRNRIRR
jgi:uncharacterized protein (DUF58 family)